MWKNAWGSSRNVWYFVTRSVKSEREWKRYEKSLSHRLIFIYYLEKISHGKILEETELQRILR